MGKGFRVSDQQLDERVEKIAKEIAQTRNRSERRRLQQRLKDAKVYKRLRAERRAEQAEASGGATPGSESEGGPALDTASASAPDIQVIEGAPKAPRAFKPRISKAEAEEAAKVQKAKDEAGAQAAMLLLMLDSLAASTAGDEARLNAYERALIEPALVRVMARMDEQRAAMIQKYADPVMILAGTSLWLVRMRQISKERNSRRDDNLPPRPPDTPDASPPPNGNQNRADVEAMKLHHQIQDFFSSPERER